MTLKDFFEKKELYEGEKENGINNYLHNLKVIQSENIRGGEKFKIILNKTIKELYEEYINSSEFEIGEINRLKKKKMEKDYIEKYINLAKNLNEYYSQ